jgi:hypothetical protein
LIASSLLANKLNCFHELPEADAPDSEEEAGCYAEALRAAWVKLSAALKRLEAQKTK